MAGSTLTVDVERRFPRGPTIGATFDLDLAVGEALVLFGPSGAGKTTVLRAVAGLDAPDRGVITAGDVTWLDTARGIDLPPRRRRIGYLPQGFALFPHLDVRSNIGFGLASRSPGERDATVDELVGRLHLEGLERRRPGQLSGGQQQRVALARALAPRPRLLLLDEPLSALDAPTREGLRGELREILHRAGVASIVVTHDRTEALVLGDRVGVLVDGALRQLGPTLEVFDRPADEEVARIVGVETVVTGVVVASSDGLLRVRIGDAALTALGDRPVGTSILVSIRAEDVILVRDPDETAGAVSARNHVRGRVVAIEPAGPLQRVRIDCGFPLVAAVTRPALEQLALAPGVPVAAIIKAPAVHVIG